MPLACRLSSLALCVLLISGRASVFRSVDLALGIRTVVPFSYLYFKISSRNKITNLSHHFVLLRFGQGVPKSGGYGVYFLSVVGSVATKIEKSDVLPQRNWII